MIDAYTLIAWGLSWACALVLLACGSVLIGVAERWEMSARTVIGLTMVVAAGMLAGALRDGPPHMLLLGVSVALSSVSLWLVWVPHTHPVLQRCSTGFGALDDAG